MDISDLTSNEPINFIENIFHYLSTFSAHQLKVEGATYPTLEHAYHALRIKPGVERDEIVRATSPLAAWRLAQNYKNRSSLKLADLNKAELMEKLMRLKLEQHTDIKEVLLVSGNRGLLKVFGTDFYWGTGNDGSGENVMGKLWMKLRSEFMDSKDGK